MTTESLGYAVLVTRTIDGAKSLWPWHFDSLDQARYDAAPAAFSTFQVVELRPIPEETTQ